MEGNNDTINISRIIEALIPLLVITILGWIAWIVWHNRKTIIKWILRNKLRYFPINFNVAFSLDFKDGLNSGNYFDQIKKNINSIVDKTGLNKQIIIKDFSDIQKFNNKDEAEKFRNKKNIDLIIWGGFTNDTLKIKGENINEIELHFTYGHPDNRNRTIGKMLLLDIASRLAKKNYWKIIESNSLEDVKIISNNIFDISIYILALTLKIYGRILESLKLFEQLHKNLVERKDDFSNEILPHLYNCYEIFVIEYGIKKKDWKIGKEYCFKILNIKKDDFFGLSNLAAFESRLGNNSEVENLVNKLLSLYPGNHITEVDVAYVRILQKNYNNAFKHYRNIISSDRTNLTQEVIEFLCNEYDNKKEPALLYGIGVLSFYFWDKQLAKKNLSFFLEQANESDYKPMYREARRIIQKK